ncbi:MAG TPA: hypothetical protein P5186_27620 [Candidatus Paceibacterota bacterium]|nr:hypothetical protein [Candidatus Paceibacterota bacterium]HSA02637.1 hypothetical protein [Candidatus Paceibacterota bacterium]
MLTNDMTQSAGALFAEMTRKRILAIANMQLKKTLEGWMPDKHGLSMALEIEAGGDSIAVKTRTEPL